MNLRRVLKDVKGIGVVPLEHSVDKIGPKGSNVVKKYRTLQKDSLLISRVAVQEGMQGRGSLAKLPYLRARWTKMAGARATDEDPRGRATSQ